MISLKKQIDDSLQQVSEVNSLYRKINSNIDVIKEKFIKKLINDSYLSPGDIFTEAGDFNIRFERGKHTVLVTRINRYRKDLKIKLEPDLLRYSVLNIMEEVVAKDFYGDVFAVDNESFITLLTFKKDISVFEAVEGRILQFTGHVHELLDTYLNISVSTGIYDYLVTELTDIGDAYKYAVEACGHRFYSKNPCIVFYSSLDYSEDESEILNIALQKKLFNAVKLGEEERASEYISSIFSELSEWQRIHPEKVRVVGKMIINILSQAITELNIQDGQGRIVNFYSRAEEIDLVDNIFDLHQKLEDCIKEYMEYYYSLQKGLYSEEILRLKQYVNENLSREITLNMAATFLNVGRNYFCYIFKKETGETFYDYLINLRVEKAKELLRNTNMKNYEIAEKIGYENFNYFSTLFKKVAGVSPSGYKKSV